MNINYLFTSNLAQAFKDAMLGNAAARDYVLLCLKEPEITPDY